MSDFVFFDEDLSDDKVFKPLVEKLKKDQFLNGKIIYEGTPFTIEEVTDEL